MSMKVSANPLQNAAGRVLMDLSSYSAMGKKGRGGKGRPADADRCPCGKDSEGYDGALQGGEKRCAVIPCGPGTTERRGLAAASTLT